MSRPPSRTDFVHVPSAKALMSAAVASGRSCTNALFALVPIHQSPLLLQKSDKGSKMKIGQDPMLDGPQVPLHRSATLGFLRRTAWLSRWLIYHHPLCHHLCVCSTILLFFCIAPVDSSGSEGKPCRASFRCQVCLELPPFPSQFSTACMLRFSVDPAFRSFFCMGVRCSGH